MATVHHPAPATSGEIGDKDYQLREDIRLLGRLLGDTVRAQEGDAIFDIVENIRQTSIKFHRDNDEPARRELETILNALSPEQTVQILRAFSYFSHLANLAEDQHHVRRTRAHDIAGSLPRAGTMANALSQAIGAGLSTSDLQAFFDQALVSPVLTAHPTEVRRKSTMKWEMAISGLLAGREHGMRTPEEMDSFDEDLRRAVLTLWQTNLLRQTKLTIIDEVANGLSYYDYTFLRVLPRFYAALEDRLARQNPDNQPVPIASFLRTGSWIGGDRDGNPYVTAAVLEQTVRMQSTRALRFYLDELHELGGELSLTTRIVSVSEELAQLAANSPDRSPHRVGEPYRQAISGIYARLSATLRDLDAAASPRSPVGEAPAYASPQEFRADLDIVHASLVENGSAELAKGRLRDLRRAVDCFGFHLASLDLRQNSDVHERTVAELLEAVYPGTNYLALQEDERIALLARELVSARPLVRPFWAYSEETQGELDVLRAAARAQAVYGTRTIPTSIVSNTKGCLLYTSPSPRDRS